MKKSLTFLAVVVVAGGLISGAARGGPQGGDVQPSASAMRDCSTIECVKSAIAPTMKMSRSFALSPTAIEDPELATAVIRELLKAQNSVLTDIASEQYFALVANRVDQGIALDDTTARYNVLDDGTEELIVVGGTQADARFMLGTRNKDTGEFELVLHLAWDEHKQRIVNRANGITLAARTDVLPDAADPNPDDEPPSPLANPDPNWPWRNEVPNMQCFGAANQQGQIRTWCICYKVDSQNGVRATICFDTGWQN